MPRETKVFVCVLKRSNNELYDKGSYLYAVSSVKDENHGARDSSESDVQQAVQFACTRYERLGSDCKHLVVTSYALQNALRRPYFKPDSPFPALKLSVSPDFWS